MTVTREDVEILLGLLNDDMLRVVDDEQGRIKSLSDNIEKTIRQVLEDRLNQPDWKSIINEAVAFGWNASGEGFNAEYSHYDQEENIKELQDEFLSKYEQIIGEK